ncbi:MAG: bifunctional DNA-formamidopyrimidine glycosylase/DNA-(apurinic or apyrimidinic site) lyase [Pseudomonadota bacterium]
MPELPEVETVKRGIAPVMEGFRIDRAEIRRPDLRWPFPNNMASRLQGRQVLSLRRRGKYILADLDKAEVMLIHLGMSGRILIGGEVAGMFKNGKSELPQHDHVQFQMSSGAILTFNDPRRFGAMDLYRLEEEDQHFLIKKMGPEPLSNAFQEDYLLECMSGRRVPMKAFLLDQKVVAGLGNIYVCEALWRAGLSPRRLAMNVPKKKVRSLVAIIRDVLLEAIEAGGSSLRDYRQADGALGYFQHNFAVYDQEGQPCRKSDCDGHVSRIVQSGRSSFFCGTCQR